VGLLGHEPLLYRELTAYENLRFHARLHDVADERVHETLELVAMDGRSREPLRTLSRGMVQRVAIARAVLHDPELLLLDEPHANLDPAAVELVAMDGRSREPLRTLSRGMVQRVAIARAVLHDPELLLLDEPHANLDPAAVELVAPLIGAASGRTRVVCSHDPSGSLPHADLVLGLRAGRPAFLRSAAEVDPATIAELYR
jgi:heme exporter protein A